MPADVEGLESGGETKGAEEEEEDDNADEAFVEDMVWNSGVELWVSGSREEFRRMR